MRKVAREYRPCCSASSSSFATGARLPAGVRSRGARRDALVKEAVRYQFLRIALAMSSPISFIAPELDPPANPPETDPFSIRSKTTAPVALSTSRNKQ